MAATREQLHELIDALPAEHFDAAAHALWALTVPEDDETVTDENLDAIRLGREGYRRGETIPHDEAMRRLGLDR
ncbi:MAG: hypothetical protein M3N47_04365 [Chloroflexota bacterium]|nr:hypothetical protein [Chloroflexota bacterium]